jgi:hypothetical protein
MEREDITAIEGGFKRDLGNNVSLFLYHRMYNSIICIGETDNDYTFRDQW